MMVSILPVLLSSFFAFAGEGGTVTGNGGDVIVCKDKVMMPDVYEAEQLRKTRLSLGGPKQTVEEKVDIALNRLHRVDPARSFILKLAAKNFTFDARFVSGVVLRDIDDANDAFIPAGCTREQIAIQNMQVIPHDPFYVINKDLWDRLDNDNKAVLILHEIVFRGSAGKWPSAVVRAYASMTFSSYLEADHAYYTFWPSFEHLKDVAFTVRAAYAYPDKQRWYSEAYHDHGYQFLTPVTTTAAELKEARGNWGASAWHYCRNLEPIKFSDLENVQYIIGRNFPMRGPFRVWTLENLSGAKPALYQFSMGDSSPPVLVRAKPEDVGEVWCAGPKEDWYF
jgi:hypothetical protein